MSDFVFFLSLVLPTSHIHRTENVKAPTIACQVLRWTLMIIIISTPALNYLLRLVLPETKAQRVNDLPKVTHN